MRAIRVQKVSSRLRHVVWMQSVSLVWVSSLDDIRAGPDPAGRASRSPLPVEFDIPVFLRCFCFHMTNAT